MRIITTDCVKAEFFSSCVMPCFPLPACSFPSCCDNSVFHLLLVNLPLLARFTRLASLPFWTLLAYLSGLPGSDPSMPTNPAQLLVSAFTVSLTMKNKGGYCSWCCGWKDSVRSLATVQNNSKNYNWKQILLLLTDVVERYACFCFCRGD